MEADKPKLRPIPTPVMLRARSEFNQVAQLKGAGQTIDRAELAVLFKDLGLEKVRHATVVM
eukprot:9325753-Pyramimonas_sp.AAC.2